MIQLTLTGASSGLDFYLKPQSQPETHGWNPIWRQLEILFIGCGWDWGLPSIIVGTESGYRNPRLPTTIDLIAGSSRTTMVSQIKGPVDYRTKSTTNGRTMSNGLPKETC